MWICGQLSHTHSWMRHKVLYKIPGIPESVGIIRAMGLYPPGSLVLLSDGSVGRVISSSEDAPLRPEVIILINRIGREYRGDTGPVVDLLKDRNLFIARGLDVRGLIEKTRS